MGIGNSFAMLFGHRMRFRWDIFNVTNTVPFTGARCGESPAAPPCPRPIVGAALRRTVPPETFSTGPSCAQRQRGTSVVRRCAG